MDCQEENKEKVTEWKNNFDTKKFLSPARHCGGSAGIQYDFKNMGVYASADFPLWLMFWGLELDVAKSKNAAQDAKLMKSLDFNTGIRLGMQFTWFEQWLSPYFAVTAGMSYDSPVKQFGWYVGGDVTLHTLAIADLFYRYRYNFTEKQSENMIGVALAINGPWKGNKKSQKK